MQRAGGRTKQLQISRLYSKLEDGRILVIIT